MNLQIVILALIFLSVSGAAFALVRWLERRSALRQRMSPVDGTADAAEKSLTGGSAWQARVVKVVGPMAKLSAPTEGWETSTLRVRFMHAGLREANWPVIFFGTKSVLAVLLPVAFLLYQRLAGVELKFNNHLMVLVVLVALGYYLPNMVLSSMVKRRQREVMEALPDALDLMIVCVEAGLGLDAAMNRAAGEIGLRSKALSEELNLLALELRMGLKREQALRNLALRTGVDDVAAFVTMLVQSDRFGTNVADALRVQAETMRVHRRLRAEEKAAKIPLKLLFPLIFFIFPSLLLVLMGPAMISIYRTLLPTFSGTN